MAMIKIIMSKSKLSYETYVVADTLKILLTGILSLVLLFSGAVFLISKQTQS